MLVLCKIYVKYFNQQCLRGIMSFQCEIEKVCIYAYNIEYQLSILSYPNIIVFLDPIFRS